MWGGSNVYTVECLCQSKSFHEVCACARVCVCVRGGSLVNIYRIEEIFPWGDMCVCVSVGGGVS